MLIPVAKRLLDVVPDAIGFPVVKKLSARTLRSPAHPTEAEAMRSARRFLLAGRAAWSWGEGPTVLLIHGWWGRAAQMAPLAFALAEQGFRAVAFDVSGHGESPGKTASWYDFVRDIELVGQALEQPIYACVGHSAGALTLMTVRGHGRIRAQRYVTLCSPSHPFPPLRFIERILGPSPGVMAQYQDYLGRQFGHTWQSMETGVCFAGAGSDLMLVYDVGDRVVPMSEGEKLRALCPGSRVFQLGPYGHTRMLRAPELGVAIGEFLTVSDPIL